MKFLVADDSRVMRQIIIRALRQAGYDDHEIIEAQDGRDAVAKARAEDPDLVLCDWHMPQMTGLDCLEALRSAGSTVPFGFITSDSSLEMRQKAAAAGAGFLLGKPFDAEMLRRAVDGALTPSGESPESEGVAAPQAAVPPPGTGSRLPSAKDVRDMLATLLGRPVTVAAGRRVMPTGERPAAVATYVDPRRTVVAMCLLDLPLSAYVGGALALLPAGGVQDTVDEDGELTPVLVDGLREVLNVLSGPLTKAGGHATLAELHVPGGYVPDDLLVMASGFDRLDLVVDVPGYGSGSFSLVRTD